MRTVIKKHRQMEAYRLGTCSPVLNRLMAEGKLIDRGDGTFELFSQEALLGASGQGQIAPAGSYLKLDSAGFPYPNDEAYFLANHRHISGDLYEQLAKPLPGWTSDQPECEEIAFLMLHKGLQLQKNDPEHYFSAPLYGTVEAAPKDAVVIFHGIDRDPSGNITDIRFNFVRRDEFDRTYVFCES